EGCKERKEVTRRKKEKRMSILRDNREPCMNHVLYSQDEEIDSDLLDLANPESMDEAAKACAKINILDLISDD
ncbi:MAG: hypothetical protein ACXACA_08095, partial [Candidatus Ranarchaeia archaeon]